MEILKNSQLRRFWERAPDQGDVWRGEEFHFDVTAAGVATCSQYQQSVLRAVLL